MGVPSPLKQHGRTARSLRFWPCVAGGRMNHHDLSLFSFLQKFQTYSDYISTIIFRDTAPGRLLQMNFVKTFGHYKVALSSKFGLGYFSHSFLTFLQR